MKLFRYGPLGSEKPAVTHGDTTYDISSLTADIDGEFLASNGIGRVRAALAEGALNPIDVSGERVGAPVARPSALICIGMNYAAHAAESGSAPPSLPVIFLKTPNTLVGPFDDVVIPQGSEKTDWEVELAIVIGQRASYLASAEEAPQFIAGFTIANDVSERAWQIDLSGGQWSKGKCAPTFNPLGPYLIPADEFDPHSADLTSRVNGESRQDSNTRDMIFDVNYLVWHLSQFMTLEPGDVINTGTPQGVALSGRFPYLRDGDVMELSIAGLGVQRQQVRAWSGAQRR